MNFFRMNYRVRESGSVNKRAVSVLKKLDVITPTFSLNIPKRVNAHSIRHKASFGSVSDVNFTLQPQQQTRDVGATYLPRLNEFENL